MAAWSLRVGSGRWLMVLRLGSVAVILCALSGCVPTTEIQRARCPCLSEYQCCPTSGLCLPWGQTCPAALASDPDATDAGSSLDTKRRAVPDLQPPSTTQRCQVASQKVLTWRLAVPNLDPSCAFGTNGNLEPSDGSIQARVEESYSLLPGSFEGVVCAVELAIPKQDLFYNDIIVIAFNERVLMASINFADSGRVPKMDGFFVYDWAYFKGGTDDELDSPAGQYCLGNEGLGQLHATGIDQGADVADDRPGQDGAALCDRRCQGPVRLPGDHHRRRHRREGLPAQLLRRRRDDSIRRQVTASGDKHTTTESAASTRSRRRLHLRTAPARR